MTDLNKRNRPEPEIGDKTHTLIKAGLSAVPIIGGAAAEIFSTIIVPPLNKRRDEWIEQIIVDLTKLEEEIDGFSIEVLSQSDMFITTIMNATQIAIRNHQTEKLEALKHAVLNTALSNTPEEDIQFLFLNFIDTFAPWHLKILKFFDNPNEWRRKYEITCPDWVNVKPATVLEHTFSELSERRDFYDQLTRDLYSRGLIDRDKDFLHTTTTSMGMIESHTTKMGKDFIKYIESPL